MTTHDYAGRGLVVLLWNPACGFCRGMLSDLRAWETERTGDAPELLVVSTGKPEENRAMGLASRVALDQDFATGRTFGATPSAVRVDRSGRINSGVVVGAPAVMDLLGQTAREPVA